MEPLDKNYLLLQFKDRIHTKWGNEFQSFFEDIMIKSDNRFRKVPSFGGDGGNDGWIKELGRYYQIYSPVEPLIKDSEAAKKMKNNFIQIKNNWDEITEVKEYYFVYNDKYKGSKKPEETISELKREYPEIEFDVFQAKHLEEVFFKLDKSKMLSLHFDIDSTKAVKNAYQFLKNVEVELDRECGKSAQSILGNIKDIITDFDDEELSLYYELLECRCLKKLENINEARTKYENIIKRNPDDPRAYLFLAEIYLFLKDYGKNKELLEKARAIDPDFWQLKTNELARSLILDEKIDLESIDSKKFGSDSKIKSIFYRIYSLILGNTGDHEKALSFIEKAIHYNPDGFDNYISKLSLLELKHYSDKEVVECIKSSPIILDEIKKTEKIFERVSEIGFRNKAVLSAKKLNPLQFQENYEEFERVAKLTFDLAINCHLDVQIEQIFSQVLRSVKLPDQHFKDFLTYLSTSKLEFSNEFLKILFFQFVQLNTLFSDGRAFYQTNKGTKLLDLIKYIENSEYDGIIELLQGDVQFAATLANTLKDHPELRRKIINSLPDDDEKVQKDRLWILLNYDENEYDNAFEIIKNMDLSFLTHYEYQQIFKICRSKEAWDLEVVVLEKLIENEKDEKYLFNLKFELFTALLNLKKQREVIELGKVLLDQDSKEKRLEPVNKEWLLFHVLRTCLNRIGIDKESAVQAKEILKKFEPADPTFEFSVGITFDVYIRNKNPQKALESIIQGVKTKKTLNAEEYANLHLRRFFNIGYQISIDLTPLEKVENNTFVKLKNEETWYYIGEDNKLDAVKISKSHKKYESFLGHELNKKIIFEDKLRSIKQEDEIEYIFPIEKYIAWRARYYFFKMSQNDDLEGVWMMKVPENDGKAILEQIKNFLDDESQSTKKSFDTYCNNPVPFAVLAISEGSIERAFGRIQGERRGFINFSSGEIKEFDSQKELAKQVIENELPFYLDGISALVLSEYGILKQISHFIPNLKVPQSVIELLIHVTDKFTFFPGQIGNMGYARGKVIFNEKKEEDVIFARSNIVESIKLLESKPENIDTVSLANKSDSFLEQKIPAELCDACILAQREKIPILTDDYLYLKANEFETKKEAPQYFSSMALIIALYKMGHYSFEDYHNFFYYLSNYRFRFLSVNTDDLEKAIFGEGKIISVNYRNIDKFNFKFTLSEEYGVTLKNIFGVLKTFFFKLITDDSITPDTIERIFIEILKELPIKFNKKKFAQKLLKNCFDSIKNNKSDFIIFPH